MGIMNTCHGYDNPVYNVHKNMGARYTRQNTAHSTLEAGVEVFRQEKVIKGGTCCLESSTRRTAR